MQEFQLLDIKIKPGGCSPQVIPETAQPWETTGSLVQGQHEFALTPSSQLDVHESEFEAVHDTFHLMDYTPQSMELDGYPFLDYQMQIAAGGIEVPTPNKSDKDMISKTTIASAPDPAPVAPTDTRRPASKVTTCVPRSKKQNGSASSTRLRKRSFQKTNSEPLEEYIVLEKKRCIDTGLIFLETDFNLSTLKAHVSLQKVEPHLSALSILYFGVGSPETLATLQVLLKTRREPSVVQQRREKHVLSPAERAIAIERTDAKLAYCSLRKRCHVYQLYLDCSSESLRTSDTFVTNTVQTMTTRHKPQNGNPLNLEISRVLNRMLILSYPNLYPDDPNYGQKKNYVNGLRKLGQHLHLLVERFGYGILGLIPLPSNEPTFVQGLNLTNEAYVILCLRDVV